MPLTLAKLADPAPRPQMERAGLVLLDVLSEFGGIAYAPKSSGVWGYSWAKTETELAQTYRALIDTVNELPLLAGFCYTQLTDTYQEANGLLYADRRPKASIDILSLLKRMQKR